jgi:hypothetical protein
MNLPSTQRTRAIPVGWALVPFKPAQRPNTTNNNINEMHGSISKIPSKKSRQAALRGGI